MRLTPPALVIAQGPDGPTFNSRVRKGPDSGVKTPQKAPAGRHCRAVTPTALNPEAHDEVAVVTPTQVPARRDATLGVRPAPNTNSNRGSTPTPPAQLEEQNYD